MAVSFFIPHVEQTDAAAGTTGVQPGIGDDGRGRTDTGRQIVRFPRAGADTLGHRIWRHRGNMA